MIVSIHSERGYLTQKMQNQIWIHTNCDHAIARCALELENLAIIIIMFITMMHKTMQFCGHNCHQPHLAFPDIFLFDFSVSFFSTNHRIGHSNINTCKPNPVHFDTFISILIIFDFFSRLPPGFGVEQIRDNNYEIYWQFDGQFTPLGQWMI